MGTIALVVLAGQGWATSPVNADFSRYRIILDRMPFGEPPEAPKPAQGPDAGQPAAPPAPPFTRDLRMCAITECEAGIRVGLINIKAKPQKLYFLSVGDIEDEIELVEANYLEERAKLRKGDQEEWISLDGSSGKPAASKSQTVASAGRTALSGRSRRRNSGISYADRLKRRREALAERRKRDNEKPRLTGKELEEHLQDYQMQLIRDGLPPLPLQLTKEMDAALVAEGVLPPLE